MSTKQQGSTLIEILVVSVIVVVSLTAMAQLSMISINRNRMAKERTVATRLAQEAVEWLRFQRDRLGFDTFIVTLNAADESQSFYLCANELPTDLSSFFVSSDCTTPVEGYLEFTRLIKADYLSDVLTYKVDVSWPGGPTGTNTVSLEGKLTKWQK